ncbi:MAG TPA: alkaline phosphatase D family protein [Gemmatimonadaceae bacterium]
MLRRDFLIDLTKNAALCATVPSMWRLKWRPSFADDPFQLGVGSGDPTPTGGVIWTRLAPRPLDPDAGMTGLRTVVNWEVAEDEKFSKVAKQGRATAAPELGYSVHIDLDGLSPERWYFYRFHSGEAVSPVGRLRTTPAAATQTPLRFAFVSCQHWEDGHYTAYQHMSRESLDLVAHLGDYIYEYGSTTNPNAVRRHATSEIRDLAAYRTRYAQYKSDPALQAAHALCPWVVIWDDHEVDNNYANLSGENDMESEEQMRTRRAAAYQAWWENQPVRVPRAKSWADLTITRTIDWGGLARFHMLDGRQYRSNQPCGDGNQIVPCGDWADPKHTMLGEAQEKWLTNGLAKSTTQWQVIANQVMVAPYDTEPGEKIRLPMDHWSGYPAARDRMLTAIQQHAANKTVVITGDIHSNWVNELHSGFDRPDRPTVAAEFVGTSITSGGDGQDQSPRTTAALAENPHVKWQNSRRGYVVCAVDTKAWNAEYRTIPFVRMPDAPLAEPKKFRVEHGRPGITPA